MSLSGLRADQVKLVLCPEWHHMAVLGAVTKSMHLVGRGGPSPCLRRRPLCADISRQWPHLVCAQGKLLLLMSSCSAALCSKSCCPSGPRHLLLYVPDCYVPSPQSTRNGPLPRPCRAHMPTLCCSTAPQHLPRLFTQSLINQGSCQCSSRRHCSSPPSSCMLSQLRRGPPQLVLSYDTEGGIAKMVSNKVAATADGRWLLPFWREMGGTNCTQDPGMHGRPGLLSSADGVRPCPRWGPLHVTEGRSQHKLRPISLLCARL